MRLIAATSSVCALQMPLFSGDNVFKKGTRYNLFMPSFNHPVVLFDGVCNFCNSMINFAIRNDTRDKLRFTPLQSVTGKALRSQYRIAESIDSIVLVDNGKAYTHADAAFRIARYLSYPAKALYILNIIPSFISKPVYNWVARNRYKWFGKKESCMIPTPAVKARFIE